MDAFVEQQVTTGRHQSASKVVREALRRYGADLAAEAACIELIRGIAHEGRDAIARGDFAMIDCDDAREALFRRITGKAPENVSPVG